MQSVGEYSTKGIKLNAFDWPRPALQGENALPMLVVVRALAELAQSDDPQAALSLLADGFGLPLRLILGAQVWTAPAQAPVAGGTLGDGGAALQGLPDGAGPEVTAALQAFLQAVQAQWVRTGMAAARDAANPDALFEVDAAGVRTGWCNQAALSVMQSCADAWDAISPAVQSLLSGQAMANLSLTFPDRVHQFTVHLRPAGLSGRWLVKLHDHTALSRLERRLGRRDHLLRQLFDLSPIGVVLLDFDNGAIIEANEAFLGFGGWVREDLIDTSVHDLLTPENAEMRDTALYNLTENGRFGPLEDKLQRPDGTRFPAILRGLKLDGRDGQQIVWLMVEDVSALRAHLAEVQAVQDEAVRARAELHTAMQALPHGFILFDAEDRVVMVNDQMATVYPELAKGMVPGRPYRDVLADGIAKGLFPQAKGREKAFFDCTMAGRRQPVFESFTELPNGRLMRVLERATPTGGRVGLRIDVTAEREAERRLSQVIEGSQTGTWECDFLTGENIVNDRWLSMIGWSRAELSPITLETWHNLLHAEDRPRVNETIVRVRTQETAVFDVAFRMRHRAGHWVWVQSRGQVTAWAEDGTPRRMSGVHVDVSALKAAEDRLEQIIEGAEVGTWRLDLATGASHVNDQWANMLGYGPGEIMVISHAMWTNLVHPDDERRLQMDRQQGFSTPDCRFESEIRLRHRAGHWVWVLTRGRATEWNAEGAPIVLSGVHLDISARKQLETDLEVERDFLSTLMETSISGIMAVDAASRIVFFNREVQRIFELPSEAILNKLCDPTALGLRSMEGKPLDFGDLPCQLVQACGQTLRDIRIRIGLPDGREKVVSVNAALLPDAVESARVVCTITDITAASQAEDALRGAIDRAEAANRAKSQFLTNMSHELRTPLNGVLGMADLMHDGTMQPSHRAMLRTIRESGSHLLSILNDILDLSKIESGKVTLDLAPVDLADLVTRVQAMHALGARGKGLGFNVVMGEGVAQPRLGDAQRLMQIMHNLVGNAVKFTERGEVTVSLWHCNNPVQGVELVVADTGIGMTKEQSEIVFDEFTQGDGSITRRFGGTGLGLPIARRLVKMMGGDIALTSVEGEGTTVNVRLPLPLCPPMPQSDTPPVLSAHPVPMARFSALRVLLAEDNATNRMILRAMLTRLGIAVTVAEDGDEAVACWQPDAFDIVLLDISMPRKDGLTALAELRAKAGDGGLPPVVAVTAHAMAQNQQEYLDAGFAAVVAKPVSLEALVRAIAGLHSRSLLPALQGKPD